MATPVDAFIVQRVCTPVSKRLPRAISPNAITLAGGWCAIAAHASARRAWGASFFVFHIAYLFCDCLDGTVARYRGLCTSYGAFLDHAVDAHTTLLVYHACTAFAPPRLALGIPMAFYAASLFFRDNKRFLTHFGHLGTTEANVLIAGALSHCVCAREHGNGGAVKGLCAATWAILLAVMRDMTLISNARLIAWMRLIALDRWCPHQIALSLTTNSVACLAQSATLQAASDVAVAWLLAFPRTRCPYVLHAVVVCVASKGAERVATRAAFCGIAVYCLCALGAPTLFTAREK